MWHCEHAQQGYALLHCICMWDWAHNCTDLLPLKIPNNLHEMEIHVQLKPPSIYSIQNQDSIPKLRFSQKMRIKWLWILVGKKGSISFVTLAKKLNIQKIHVVPIELWDWYQHMYIDPRPYTSGILNTDQCICHVDLIQESVSGQLNKFYREFKFYSYHFHNGHQVYQPRCWSGCSIQWTDICNPGPKMFPIINLEALNMLWI